ncbi:MAG TPA: hypothetical protein DCZ91_01260 [Lachnospiraceae bacterium]|nr:hypothetical protein [Lachnospiraceae bacterium]
MRRKTKTILNFILACSLTAGCMGFGTNFFMVASASSVSEIEGQINQHTNQLESINNQIVAMESEQDILQEQIDDLNAEILNMMTTIGLKEDEIAAKEEEISQKEAEIARKEEEIAQKQLQIVQTEEEYKAAMEREADQRENMVICARMIYERGEDSVLDAILEGKGLSDILNHMDRVEKVHEYENSMLLQYIEVKNQVHELWMKLEDDKAQLEEDRKQLEADKQQLQADRQQLEADREELKGQKASLDSMLAKKKQQSANYDAEIKKARQEAAVAKKLLQQDKAKLARAKAAAAAAAQNAAGSGGSSSGGGNAGSGGSSGGTSASSGSSAVANSSGSATGKQIAQYALQYVGNPYVSGGTSLTNGADCSGFIYRVFSDFGYSVSRTSYQQRNNGTAVNYSDAQPGDIICYEGHVGLYIGDGLIVHASNSRPYPSGGIKVSQAQYRTILGVRRIVN